MNRIIRFVILDILKNKIVLAYAVFLAFLAWTVFALEDNSTKGMLTLLQVILFTVPLVSIVFATIYIYNSVEFIELLLSQPIQRKRIWISLFSGLNLSLCLAFLIGAGIPIIIYTSFDIGLMMLIAGMFITLIFVSLAFLSAIQSRDKAKGIGISIIMWLYFALLFDSLVLFLLFQLSDYPIEKLMVFISIFNPIDLSRILLLLKLDISAMMGYTGAIFKDFFGTWLGSLASIIVLFLWVLVPFLISLSKFNRKDL